MKGMPGDETTGPGTTVGVNVALSGTLKDQNDIHIHGLVDGEVISEKAVTIGKTAQIKGPVRGQFVTIAGVVRGSIEASQKLELLDTAKVFGSITTHDLVIHSGATFIGKSTMPSDETSDELSEEEAAPEVKTEEPVAAGASVEEDLKPEEE